MNRIDAKFKELKEKNKKALISFITVGDPSLETCEKAVLQLEADGVDLIELGVPFSDPAADGPTIQAADVRAIEKGVDIFVVLDFVAKIRSKVQLPLVFLMYYNVIMQYGAEKFFKKCKEVGVDGVIIPDLPYEECGEIKEFLDENGIYQIQLVTPTSHERIEKIASISKGFLYCVSTIGVTGMKSEFSTDFPKFYEEIRKYTDIPACLGFGISKGEQIKQLHDYFDGFISGSALVDAMAKGNNEEESLKNLAEVVADLRSGLKE